MAKDGWKKCGRAACTLNERCTATKLIYCDVNRRGLFDMRRDLGRAPTAQEWADERR